MKSYHLDQAGSLDGLVVREHDIPVPGPRHVLVRMRANALNARDLGVLPAHESLDGKQRVLRVGHGLAFRDLADEALAVLGEGRDRRRCAGAFLVDDDRRLTGFHHGHHGVGRPEVNSNHSAHRIHSGPAVPGTFRRVRHSGRQRDSS